MGCYISSNDNRLYAAVETSYGQAAAVTSARRFPAVRLELQEQTLTPGRRDKTGGRTFVGLPGGFRKKNAFGVTTYMSAWDPQQGEPGYGALFQGAMGAAPLVFGGGVVAGVAGQQLTFAQPHGLEPDQAVACNGEIRFVEGVVDTTAVLLNAPFTTSPSVGAMVTETITFKLATSLPGVTVHDYWDPSDAVQRVVAGGGVDKMRVRLNGDFHQFEFTGEAVDVIDSLSFSAGVAGLTAFPTEPALGTWDYSLVPGNLGQVWAGLGPAQMFNVLEADVMLDNDIALRTREFGVGAGTCLSAGIRRVTANLRLLANTSTAMQEIYQAAKQRSAVPLMLQLGQQEGQLCGVYLKALIPEVPELDDRDTRLEWTVRSARAQGVDNDEMVVAFA
jgi:hypothetical protein